ncbi:hypothetical protein GpartN1_g4969.t1 [Galdieria partita]|uniref:DNA topoisomerase n=1 Tax=Galdieria partita TaxID=83374 RepID=A0A9C7UPD6_9RHOD|nr:hypothetical protein GpartN1_g2615.t1 [Galdieria partita]GJQ13178.1 hypothetical protein GpartN1_g4969.t1 [Galdieria partita]
MKRILNVAEKPSAARELSYALATKQNIRVREVGSRLKVYEFEFDLNRERVTMIFSSVAGHIKALDFHEYYRCWDSCDQLALLDPSKTPVKEYVPEDKKFLENSLKNEARSCCKLFLWLDCDSEGEKIAYEVLDICQQENRSLRIPSNVKRARFSAITAQDARKALQNLTTLHYPTVSMVSTRQEIDLRAGAAFTRFLTKFIQNRFRIPLKGDKNVILSYGPCQFPTLGLVVDRLLTIRAFQPRLFYYLELTISCESSYAEKYVLTWDRKHLFDRYCCALLYELCYSSLLRNNFHTTISDVKKTSKTRRRPFPLDTVELQRLASREFNFSSDKTMKVAESLYSEGYISYPRTETNIFPSTIDLSKLVLLQQNDPRWQGFVQKIMECWSHCSPRQGTKDDKAHPPIHPIKAAPKRGFKDKEFEAIYELVTRRFLACCSIDAKGYETIITVKVGFESFHIHGLSIEEAGYLQVYPYEHWSERVLPTEFEEGTSVHVVSLMMKEGSTSAPKPLSESDLLGLMDKYGIGTDATMAEHIRKIQNREYVTKQGNFFYPMALGLALVEAFEACEAYLARPTSRSEQERDLRQISQGSRDASDVLYSALSAFTCNLQKLQTAKNVLHQVFSVHFDSI